MLNTKQHRNESTATTDRWVLGIDLGGTSIKLGLFRGHEVVSRHEIQTSDFTSPHHAFLSAREFISRKMDSESHSLDDLSTIGLAMAGVLDQSETSLRETANLKRWHGVDFRKELFKVFSKPVAILNDANAAAFGESSHDKFPTDSLVLVTLGTGLGRGIIEKGRVYRGAHHCDGEIGHTAIEFGISARVFACGRPGHLEFYAGAAGIVRSAAEALSESKETSTLQIWEALTPRDIAEAAERNDAVAIATIRRTAIYLGRAIAMLASTVDPAVVLLGGAMNFGGPASAAGTGFLQAIRDKVTRLSLSQVGEHLRIDFATLGNDAGVFGASNQALRFATRSEPESSLLTMR